MIARERGESGRALPRSRRRSPFEQAAMIKSATLDCLILVEQSRPSLRRDIEEAVSSLRAAVEIRQARDDASVDVDLFEAASCLSAARGDDEQALRLLGTCVRLKAPMLLRSIDFGRGARNRRPDSASWPSKMATTRSGSVGRPSADSPANVLSVALLNL